MIINLKNILVLNCFLGLAQNTQGLASIRTQSTQGLASDKMEAVKGTSVLDNQPHSLQLEESKKRGGLTDGISINSLTIAPLSIPTLQGIIAGSTKTDEYKAKAIESCDQQNTNTTDQRKHFLTQEAINAIIPTFTQLLTHFSLNLNVPTLQWHYYFQ